MTPSEVSLDAWLDWNRTGAFSHVEGSAIVPSSRSEADATSVLEASEALCEGVGVPACPVDFPMTPHVSASPMINVLERMPDIGFIVSPQK